MSLTQCYSCSVILQLQLYVHVQKSQTIDSHWVTFTHSMSAVHNVELTVPQCMTLNGLCIFTYITSKLLRKENKLWVGNKMIYSSYIVVKTKIKWLKLKPTTHVKLNEIKKKNRNKLKAVKENVQRHNRSHFIYEMNTSQMHFRLARELELCPNSLLTCLKAYSLDTVHCPLFSYV